MLQQISTTGTHTHTQTQKPLVSKTFALALQFKWFLSEILCHSWAAKGRGETDMSEVMAVCLLRLNEVRIPFAGTVSLMMKSIHPCLSVCSIDIGTYFIQPVKQKTYKNYLKLAHHYQTAQDKTTVSTERCKKLSILSLIRNLFCKKRKCNSPIQ